MIAVIDHRGHGTEDRSPQMSIRYIHTCSIQLKDISNIAIQANEMLMTKCRLCVDICRMISDVVIPPFSSFLLVLLLASILAYYWQLIVRVVIHRK